MYVQIHKLVQFEMNWKSLAKESVNEIQKNLLPQPALCHTQDFAVNLNTSAYGKQKYLD